VALGPAIRGRVYEDEGEGFAPGAWSELKGAFDGKRLVLAFEDRSGHPREGVWAEVLGVAPPVKGQGVLYREGRLLLDLGPGEAFAEWA
jgi:alpha-glucosidase